MKPFRTPESVRSNKLFRNAKYKQFIWLLVGLGLLAVSNTLLQKDDVNNWQLHNETAVHLCIRLAVSKCNLSQESDWPRLHSSKSLPPVPAFVSVFGAGLLFLSGILRKNKRT